MYNNDDDRNIIDDSDDIRHDDDKDTAGDDDVDVDDDDDNKRPPPPTQPPPTLHVIGKVSGNCKTQGLSTFLDLGRAEIVVTAATPMVEDGIDKSFPPLEEEEEEDEDGEDNGGHDHGDDKNIDRNRKNMNDKDDDKAYKKQIHTKNKDEKIINKASTYGNNRRDPKTAVSSNIPAHKKVKPSMTSNIGKEER